MNKRTVVAVLYCLVIFLAGASSVFGQAKGGGLRKTGITIKMESQPLGRVFSYLMAKYDIPIGFEESTLDRNFPDYEFYANLPVLPKYRYKTRDGKTKVITVSKGQVFNAMIHPITLDLENESLAKVFDHIMWQMENYRWEINDGVVNIFPVKGRDPRFEKLMGLKIQSFAFAQGDAIRDITKYIKMLPEFIMFLAENKLDFIGWRGETSRVRLAEQGRAINVDMDFSNLTFRDLLNKITKIKRGGWSLRWKGRTEEPGWEKIDIDI